MQEHHLSNENQQASSYARLRLVGLLFLGTLAPVISLPAMDQVRIESRIDQAVATYAVTGRGVIVATLDRGIDWKNNDFRNADGSTRIKYIFDLTDNSGANAANNPYHRGTIYTEAQINAALTGGPNLATRDAVAPIPPVSPRVMAAMSRNIAASLLMPSSSSAKSPRKAPLLTIRSPPRRRSAIFRSSPSPWTLSRPMLLSSGCLA
jgi:subtilisin family serine protease